MVQRCRHLMQSRESKGCSSHAVGSIFRADYLNFLGGHSFYLSPGIFQRRPFIFHYRHARFLDPWNAPFLILGNTVTSRDCSLMPDGNECLIATHFPVSIHFRHFLGGVAEEEFIVPIPGIFAFRHTTFDWRFWMKDSHT